MELVAPQLRRIQAEIERILAKQIFFVVGYEKSGTMWLSRILDQHPAAISRGEIHFASRLGPMPMYARGT